MLILTHDICIFDCRQWKVFIEVRTCEIIILREIIKEMLLEKVSSIFLAELKITGCLTKHAS